MSLVSAYETPWQYESTLDTPLDDPIDAMGIPTFGPHGAIVSHTFPSSAKKGVNLPFSFDIHNDGTEGQIAFGIMNVTGNPGKIVCTYQGTEITVNPAQYYRIYTVNPVPNCTHLAKSGSIRFEATGNYEIKLMGMWFVDGKWYYSSAEAITKNVPVTVDGEPPPPTPPSNGVVRTYAFFSNYHLKAQTWDRVWVGKTESASTGTPKPISAKLRYEVLYEAGTMPANRVRIRYNGDIMREFSINKGALVTGEIDVTGRILSTDSVRVGLRTYLGEWDDVRFTVLVDYTYATEPTEDPSEEKEDEFKEFLNKYKYWLAGGGLVLAYLLIRRPAMPIIVMPRGEK